MAGQERLEIAGYAIGYLAANARRAKPERDRKTGRGKLGLVHVGVTLGGFAGTLLCDGHEAYLHYARITRDVIHAQCWAHTRRHFEGAQSSEPAAVAEALALIGELYRIEKHIRKEGLSGEAKLACRIEHARPVCDG